LRIPDVGELSLEARIGQTLCFGWQGASPEEDRSVNSHARALIEEMRVGSVVLLGRNVSPPDQMRATLDGLQGLSAIPLFVAVDQEGGSFNRFRPPVAPFHEFPGAMALGAITEAPDDSPDQPERYAYLQSRAQAEELLAVGVNWNFAPVADVNSNPANPIIGVRSFGENPHLVARYVAEAVRGYQEAGLLACAKHFPGHGDTSVDSHLALPTVRGDRGRLDQVELPAFRAAIRAGVGAIMTTHILFPELDEERAATVSPTILTGLLREELQFDGLVITDCLEMEAIAGTIGTPRAAVEALKAGADIVLVCHTLEPQRATVEAIREAVRNGELQEERLNEAVGRVLAAKRRFLPAPRPADSPWERESHQALERTIARKAVTALCSPCRPRLILKPGDHATIISDHSASHDLAAILEARGIRCGMAGLDRPDLDVDALHGDSRVGALIVVAAPDGTTAKRPVDQEKQAMLVRRLHRLGGARLIVVATREPYLLRDFPSIDYFLCGYGFQKCTLEAIADALTGGLIPTGEFPVTVR
jgi:beta-N-acetylhexosaminidase